MARTVRLRLASSPSEAKRLRSELHRWLLEAGINGSTGAEIVLAANEAFINAVEHPRDRRSGEIAVSGLLRKRQVVLQVDDDGLWKDQSDPGRDHFGYGLMKTLMSSVRVTRSREGTRVVLTRRFPAE